MENIIEFCKLNRDIITKALIIKDIVIEDSNQFETGYREVLDKNYNCTVIQDKRIACIEGKQILKNHILPHRIISIDFTFNTKKHSINVNGKTVYYSYCVL